MPGPALRRYRQASRSSFRYSRAAALTGLAAMVLRLSSSARTPQGFLCHLAREDRVGCGSMRSYNQTAARTVVVHRPSSLLAQHGESCSQCSRWVVVPIRVIPALSFDTIASSILRLGAIPCHSSAAAVPDQMRSRSTGRMFRSRSRRVSRARRDRLRSYRPGAVLGAADTGAILKPTREPPRHVLTSRHV